MKKLREIVEATKSLHPMALHVKPVMVNGQQKYKVHAVGKDLADGIKHGEHLSDSELDDAHEMGAKVKHVKESVNEGKMAELDHDLENMKDKDFETHYGEPKSAYRPAKKPVAEPKPSNVKEAMSHQAATTMKHIPNPSPALKKAAKDIKPGIAGFRDRIAMLKAGGVKEEVEELDELSKSTLGSYAKKASRDAVITRKIGVDFENKADRARSPGMKAASDEISQRFKSKSFKRRAGVDKAIDRLTKEETGFGPEADKNITVQLKKAMDMMEHGEKTGSDVEFADGQQHFVEGVIAHKVLVAMEQMKPEIRAQAQNAVYQSFAHLMAAHQMLSK